MTAPRFRRIVVLVAALSMLTSACFQIRSINMRPKTLDIGQRGVVRLDLYPVSQVSIQANPFLLIGWVDSEMRLRGISEFDLGGNFGGPFGRVKDRALRDRLLTPGTCSFNGIDASAVTGMTKWRAYQATSGVFGEDQASKPMAVKIHMNRRFPDGIDRSDFIVFSGSVEPGGTIRCAGMVALSWPGT